MSEQLGLKFYETSCKDGNNVEKCFKDMAKELYDNFKKQDGDGSKSNKKGKSVKLEKKDNQKKKCC